MTVKSISIDPIYSKALHTEAAWEPTTEVEGNEIFPVSLSVLQAHGTFTSATRTTAGTTVIAAPKDNGSLFLTDMVLGTDKVNGATVTVRYSDGTDSIIIFSADVTDAPAHLALGFAGRWQGWKNARVELVTTGTVTATVSLGYVKVPRGLDYRLWDSRR